MQVSHETLKLNTEQNKRENLDTHTFGPLAHSTTIRAPMKSRPCSLWMASCEERSNIIHAKKKRELRKHIQL